MRELSIDEVKVASGGTVDPELIALCLLLGVIITTGAFYMLTKS